MASTTTARTRTRQATAARTAAARRPANTAPDPGFEPIRIPANADVPEERIPVFYIGDTEYTAPAHVPPGVALEYMRVATERGTDVAAGVILTRVLGEDAYRALEQARGLTSGQLNQIVQMVVDKAMGSQEGGEGKAK
jgi:hypothetical protein